MKKIALLFIFLLLTFATIAFSKEPTDLTEKNVVAAVEQYIQDNQEVIGVPLGDLIFIEVNNTSHPDSPIYWTVHYGQTYHKISVYNKTLTIHLDKDLNIYSTQNNLLKNISANTAPMISKEQIIEILKTKYSSELNGKEISYWAPNETTGGPILYIYANKLAWFTNIAYPVGKGIFIDAQNGEIIWEFQNWVSGKDVIQNPIQSDNLAMVGLIVLIIIVAGAILVLKRKK